MTDQHLSGHPGAWWLGYVHFPVASSLMCHPEPRGDGSRPSLDPARLSGLRRSMNAACRVPSIFDPKSFDMLRMTNEDSRLSRQSPSSRRLTDALWRCPACPGLPQSVFAACPTPAARYFLESRASACFRCCWLCAFSTSNVSSTTSEPRPPTVSVCGPGVPPSGTDSVIWKRPSGSTVT